MELSVDPWISLEYVNTEIMPKAIYSFRAKDMNLPQISICL